MQETETKTEAKSSPSFGRRLYDLLSGFGLATILLLLMGLLASLCDCVNHIGPLLPPDLVW